MFGFQCMLAAICVALLAGIATGFVKNAASVQRRASAQIAAKQLSAAKPLSTANIGLLSYIPRFEIGLRFQEAIDRAIEESTTPQLTTNWYIEGAQSGLESPAVSLRERILQPLRNSIAVLKASLKSFAGAVMGYFRKVIAASMIIASSLSATTIRKAATISSAVASATVALPRVARAGVLKRYSRLSPTQKLATTPLYFLCNSGGNPYLQDDVQAGNPDQKIIVYFMSSDDANDYMNEMAQSNPANLNEFRLMTTSMEKVVNRIQARKQSRKVGRYAMDTIYRIQPSSRQCENAERVAGGGNVQKGADLLKGVSVPMFTVEGMAVQRASGEVVSPYYFAYEDLLEDWAKVAAKGDAKPSEKPKVQVRDFVEVMCLSQGITTSSLGLSDSPLSETTALSDEEGGLNKKQLQKAIAAPAVIPPRRELDMIRRYWRNGQSLKNEFSEAKMMGPPKQ